MDGQESPSGRAGSRTTHDGRDVRTTATLGAEKLGLGPSVVALTQPGNWTVGFLFNQRPLSFTLGAGPTVASPEAGADWRFRLAATFLFPR
jgi:hypothetical protein